jgi:hypothetical protein
MAGVNRKDLQFLARTRLAEAKSLLEAGPPDGAKGGPTSRVSRKEKGGREPYA